MSLKYFKSGLNYTLANEDTALELAILPDHVGHIVSVAGSGGRALPLLSKRPKLLTCVDVSQSQLYLTELRIESVRALSHAEFLAFWGYPPVSARAEERQRLFNKISLSAAASGFLKAVFDSKKWESILYDGKWENTFVQLSRLNRTLTGTRGLCLFNALKDDEHRRYMETQFPRKAWLAVLTLLGNASVFNAFIYKGHFPKKNIQDSHLKFYISSFDRLFSQGPARKNFFLQLVFFGKIVFPDGLPIEAHTDVFNKCKEALRESTVLYKQGNVLEVTRDAQVPVDFVSLSDVPSYFSGDTEKGYLQMIRSGLSEGAHIIVRHYLRVTEGTDHTHYTDLTESFQKEINAEKVGVYIPEILRYGK